MGVGFVGEGEDVEDGEDCHFDAEEDAGDADFDVGIGHCAGYGDVGTGEGDEELGVC